MSFSKFDTMITHEETFCEEWDAICTNDWLAAQEEMGVVVVDEGMLEMLEVWDEYEYDTDNLAAEIDG
jgi:hypothetical protein|tara:strand:- start:371 stop:574 length:204 start_codon:yes stop_codon:yes gene_type:complete